MRPSVFTWTGSYFQGELRHGSDVGRRNMKLGPIRALKWLISICNFNYRLYLIDIYTFSEWVGVTLSCVRRTSECRWKGAFKFYFGGGKVWWCTSAIKGEIKTLRTPWLPGNIAYLRSFFIVIVVLFPITFNSFRVTGLFL